MTDQEIKQLLDSYKEGKATASDKALIESWYLNYQAGSTANLSMEERMAAVDRVWENLHDEPIPVKKISLWPKLAIAASLLLLFSLGGYLFFQNGKPDPFTIDAKNDLKPGQNKATLTLANGKKILLDDATEGQISNESGMSIRKGKSGEVVYTGSAKSAAAEGLKFNTLETFKGEQHQLILPDGTHVWLNAASAITYPVAFTGAERAVKIRGEAYFEVIHNKNKPFKVTSNGQQVEVLGTHFNINTYSDEPSAKTTLLEGSVRVQLLNARDKPLGQVKILLPGEQASVGKGQLKISRPETEEVIAWKNGYFMFESEKIGSIMRKISRWYNVEVIYKGEIPTDSFSGTVDRFANVSQILKKLQLTEKVHFKIEERRIIVTK